MNNQSIRYVYALNTSIKNKLPATRTTNNKYIAHCMSKTKNYSLSVLCNLKTAKWRPTCDIFIRMSKIKEYFLEK